MPADEQRRKGQCRLATKTVDHTLNVDVRAMFRGGNEWQHRGNLPRGDGQVDNEQRYQKGMLLVRFEMTFEGGGRSQRRSEWDCGELRWQPYHQETLSRGGALALCDAARYKTLGVDPDQIGIWPVPAVIST